MIVLIIILFVLAGFNIVRLFLLPFTKGKTVTREYTGTVVMFSSIGATAAAVLLTLVGVLLWQAYL